MIFFKKQQAVIDKIKAYLDQVDTCRNRFRHCVEDLLQHLDNDRNQESMEQVHRAESKADDLRRAIEFELYQRVLIPESRGDVLGLLENLDMIPGLFESLCYQILLQKIHFPEEFRKRYLKLVDVNLRSYDLTRKAILELFYKGEVKELADQIDAAESESDRLERRLIRDIFNSDLDKADKILLKEIVVNTGDISDTAENVKDRLTLAIVKRKI